MNRNDKYLRLLAEKYPTVRSLTKEIINRKIINVFRCSLS